MHSYLPALALVLATACTTSRPAPGPDLAPVLTLQAEGRVEVAPDEVTFSLYLACEKPSARAAAACLRDETAASARYASR